MKGKRSKRLDALRADLLSDDVGRNEYFEQRLISQLGTLVEHAIQDHRLSQSGLARSIGMHQPDLNALIRGRAAHVPTIQTLRRLAKGLQAHWVIDIQPTGEVFIREAVTKKSQEEERAQLQQLQQSPQE